MITRRSFLAAVSATACCLAAAPAIAAPIPVHIGLTAVILDQKLKILRQWQDWLTRRLGRPVRFVQRRRYREITDLLLAGSLDAAWVCGYPYVQNSDSLRLLAIPSYAGDGWYHSLIIVHVDEVEALSFDRLSGRRFVFSDPDSNSGYLYPSYRLRRMGRRVDTFFSRTFFSWGHPSTVEAIAVKLADGGAVDSYVWDMMMRYEPDLTGMTRVIERSPRFGFPPLVTTRSVDGGLHAELEGVLLTMHEEDEGRQILAAMGLDGFIPGREEYFDGIRTMARELS